MTVNRPDIIIKTKKKRKKTFILIDVTKPTVRNVKQMEVEKKLKYKSLCRDKQTWNIKCMIILATTGATGITTKRFKKKSESHSRKTFNTFATKDITHNMESTVG